jgi:HD superfamily phosphohydrolase
MDAQLTSNHYKDIFYGSILDPLHGDIKLSEIEKWIISHPLFLRLRYVRQNTFLYYVFPSANHTRFEHSIGVMHVAGKIFDACIENYATSEKKFNKYKKAEHGGVMCFHDLRKLGEKEAVLYQELRLAALLHDIGHGPMAHLFDSFSISKAKFIDLIMTDKDLKRYTGQFDILVGSKQKVEHEVMSCAFGLKILLDLRKESHENSDKFSNSTNSMIRESLNFERIISLIEPSLFQVKISIGEYDYSEFFARIVSAFPIDADRMDYLQRDSYFSGVTYGIYDINRVFASFVAFEEKGKIKLAYKQSGMDSMVRFIQSRTHLYNQVYFHKTNCAASRMLTFAARKHTGTLPQIEECSNFDSLMTFYKKNSDEFFLNETVPKGLASGQTENRVLQFLKDRKLFKRISIKRIYHSIYDKEKEKRIKDSVLNINNKLEKLETNGVVACCDLSTNISFKDVSKKDVFIAEKQDGTYTFNQNWKTFNEDLVAANLNIYMIRIFLNRDFKNSEQFESQKKEVLAFISQDLDALSALIKS